MARAIDADKAIEVAQIKYNDWNLAMAAADGRREINLCFKKQELFKAVEAVLDCVPTLTSPNEWVSVEERLPEEDKPVLCIVSGKPRSNIILDEAYQLGSWNYADGWMIDEWPDWEDAAVAWWRELPPPPDRRPPEGKEDA